MFILKPELKTCPLGDGTMRVLYAILFVAILVLPSVSVTVFPQKPSPSQKEGKPSFPSRVTRVWAYVNLFTKKDGFEALLTGLGVRGQSPAEDGA